MKSSLIKFVVCVLVSLATGIDSFSIKPNKQMTFAASPLQVVGTCPPRDTNETIFLVDDLDCRIYYVCSNGEAIPNVCPPGQAWNSELNTCDWEINVECNESSFGVKKAPKTAVGECPSKDPGMPIYLPDSSDCSTYYECSNGEAILNTCPPDMLWNTNLNTCDWPINVTCDTSDS